ncbi:MAG: hypothetical protein WEB09_06610 [Nitriliruptor sp.]
MHVRELLVPLVTVAVLVTGCGQASTPDPGAAPPDEQELPTGSEGGDPAAGACLEGTPDCVDADLSGGGAPPPDLDGELDVDAARRDARSLLGEPEEEVLELWQDVRLGRRGDEHMAVTDDQQPGRKTIATEDDGTGTFRVVEVVLELPEGSETFTDG